MSLPREKAWEAYRLYQRDLLLQCYEDAELIARRRHSLHPKEDVLLMVELLYEKRCTPWKYYRDEHRAREALDQRAGGPSSARASASEVERTVRTARTVRS